MPLNAAIVGASTEPVVHAIDARWLMAYTAGLGETLPCYLETRRPGGIQPHPLFPVCEDYGEAQDMAEARVQQIAHEIRMLTDDERQELVAEILPLLLFTQGSVPAVTRALDTLSTEELDALVEHARTRNTALPETTIATVLRDAFHATRTPRRA